MMGLSKYAMPEHKRRRGSSKGSEKEEVASSQAIKSTLASLHGKLTSIKISQPDKTTLTGLLFKPGVQSES